MKDMYGLYYDFAAHIKFENLAIMMNIDLDKKKYAIIGKYLERRKEVWI